MLTVLEVRLCKPTIYKLKSLGGGNLNITNQWGELQKEGNQVFKVPIFDLHLLGGGGRGGRGHLGGNYDLLTRYLTPFILSTSP